jgi:hypothetical protein
MKKLMKLIIGFFLLLATTSNACAAYKVGPTEFAEEYKADSSTLKLRGAGLKKFLGIQVVTVALYLPEGTASKDALLDSPKRLEVVYLQNIPKKELQRATIKGIRINTTVEEYAALEGRIKLINDAYTNVKKGDRIAVTYLQHGLKITVNGVDRPIVGGDDIGWAFFAIWIGEHPVDAVMKNVLLGGKK